MSVSTHIAPGRLSRAVDRALINRPMVADDVPWAVNHHLTAAMRTFVEECAQRDVPFWNGKLSNNTFNTAGNRFKTFNWYRLWEYASCYDLLIQAFAPGARFVDVGGAGCYFSFFLAANGYKITIVDSDPYLIDLSSAMTKRLGLQRQLSCVCRDITEPQPLEIPDVDGAYSISVMEHLAQPLRSQFLRSVRALLPPSSGLAFFTFDYGEFSSPYLQSLRSLSALCVEIEQAGFVIEGNRYTAEMAQLKRKPYGAYFHDVYARTKTFCYADPLGAQMRFFFRSIGSKLRVASLKQQIKQVFQGPAPDYNFCRLLVRVDGEHSTQKMNHVSCDHGAD